MKWLASIFACILTGCTPSTWSDDVYWIGLDWIGLDYNFINPVRGILGASLGKTCRRKRSANYPVHESIRVSTIHPPTSEQGFFLRAHDVLRACVHGGQQALRKRVCTVILTRFEEVKSLPQPGIEPHPIERRSLHCKVNCKIRRATDCAISPPRTMVKDGNAPKHLSGTCTVFYQWTKCALSFSYRTLLRYITEKVITLCWRHF